MYVVTVLGNMTITLATLFDSHLHTPMYFFLCNLSFVDICFTSTTVPNMLVNMNPHVCVLFVLTSWFIIFWVALLHLLLLMHLKFSIGTEIPHFVCDLTHVLQVAFSDAHINNIVLYTATALLGMFPVTGILFSYSQIVSSLMRMSSTTGTCKAFSTCASHLCVVSLFYGTGLGMHLSSAVTHSSQGSMIASLMYTVIIPMLNPFIYSLRNKDVKGALGRLLSRAACCT
jgi:olfactory receptor